MAELSPWEEAAKAVASPKQLMPWEEAAQAGPGYAEDVLKTIPSSAVKGVVNIIGTGGDLGAIAKAASDKATEKGVNPFSALTKMIDDTSTVKWLKKQSAPYQGTRASGDLPGSYELPTSSGIKSAVENVTGPLYEAKTGPGKAVGTGIEVGTGLALGPAGGIRGLVAKSAGAGLASELAGEGAEAVKDKLPTSVQPWAEPAARAVGAVGGTFLPSVVRRGVTPLPMSDNQLAAVTALRNRDPTFPMSAGQATESPKLMGSEARSPMARNMEGRQEAAFTRNAMKEAGVPGDFRNIHQGQAVGQELGNVRGAHNMNSNEFNTLVRVIGQERRDAQRVAGRGNTPQLDEVRDAVRFGAMNNGTPVMNMPGGRYEFMRGDLQRRIEAATSPTEKQALSRIRDQMDASYKASVPADVADRLTQLESQYANYNVLRNIPPKVGRETVTPQEVLSAVGKNWGNAAANEGRGTLAPLAQDASRVMTPHPAPSTHLPPLVDLGMASVGGILGHGAESAVLGHLLANSLYNGAANLGSRTISSRPSQAYLANQMWRPGAASSTPDREALVRLLMAPTVQGQ